MPADRFRVFSAPFQHEDRGYYLYDADELKRRLALMRRALPPVFDIFYSVKANPQKRLLELLAREERIGIDASSRSEIELALSAGCSRSNILFVGPGKTRAELAAALGYGIRYFVLESEHEAQILQNLLAQTGRRQEILLRVNPIYQAKGVKMAMGGRETQFGIPQNELEAVIPRVMAMPTLSLVGIHVYVGTRILSPADCFENTRQALLLAQDLHKSGVPVQIVDVGGGMGIPYHEGEPLFDFEIFGNQLRNFIDELSPSFRTGLQCIVETGRFLMGPVGSFITKVDAVRWHENVQFVYINSTTAHFGIAGGHRLHTNRSLLVEFLSEDPDGFETDRVPTQVIGNATMDAGTFISHVAAPRLKAGDLVVFTNAGAYGSAASAVTKDLLGYPAEYLLSENGLERLDHEAFSVCIGGKAPCS